MISRLFGNNLKHRKPALSPVRYLGYALLFFGRFILFPIYWLSGFVPRERDLWVFGSWGGYRFADNAAAFFMYCRRELGDQVDLVWISRDREIVDRLTAHGHTAFHIWSLRGLIACLRARFYLFDCFVKDINFWTSRNATKINLWSGVPLKVFERDIDNPRSRYYRLFHGFLLERWFLAMMMPSHVDKPDLIIATSNETAKITQRAFALPSDSVTVTGFPRNDVLFDAERSVAELNYPLPDTFVDARDSGRKIVLYLPTFRDSGKAYMDMDWKRLDGLMAQLDATFFFKTHPMDRLKTEVSCNNVYQLPQPTDVYDILPYVDILISDYSSIIFDYMLLDRPIIYYTPDLQEFLRSSRSLLFHPQEIAVGPMCESFDALLESIESTIESGLPIDRHKRDQVFPRLHGFRDGHSCERVLQVVNERFYRGELVTMNQSIDEETTRHAEV